MLVAAAVAASHLAVAPAAHAQERPACGERPSDAEVRRRLEALETIVREQEPPVRRWYTTFALLHGTMGSAAAMLAASADNEGSRNEMLVGMTGSVLALATLLLFTPPMMGAGDQLRGHAAQTPEERLIKMRAAEDILLRAHDGVEFLHSWFPATLSLAYVALASGTLLLAFERNSGAITHSVGGTILGLGRILLHPTGARDAWRRYSRAHPDAGCEQADEPVAFAPGTSFELAPTGLGGGFVLRF